MSGTEVFSYLPVGNFRSAVYSNTALFMAGLPSLRGQLTPLQHYNAKSPEGL